MMDHEKLSLKRYQFSFTAGEATWGVSKRRLWVELANSQPQILCWLEANPSPCVWLRSKQGSNSTFFKLMGQTHSKPTQTHFLKLKPTQKEKKTTQVPSYLIAILQQRRGNRGNVYDV